MGKLDHRKIPAHTLKAEIAGILLLFAELGLSKKGEGLLRRLFTDSEWLMASRRLHIARRLLGGDGFEAIRKSLGVGWATIEHVDRWLDDELGSAREAIRKKHRDNAIHDMPFSPRWLAKTFPDHFPLLRAVLGLDRRK